MRLPAALGALLLTVICTVPAARAANTAAPTPPPAQSPLIAHKALYLLTLDTAKSNEVVAARGTMGYEVTDACDGWAVRQRLNMTITNSDGQDIQMSSDYATWESKDGLRFRYHMRQTTDTAVTSQTDGEAALRKTGGPGEAHYNSPHDSVSRLPPGTLFPMAHTAAIIAAARDKKHFLTLPLFDGTDENGVEDSFIVVIDWKPPRAEQVARAGVVAQHQGPHRLLRPRARFRHAVLRGCHALLGERRRRRYENELRRIRHEREDAGIRPATAPLLTPNLISVAVTAEAD